MGKEASSELQTMVFKNKTLTNTFLAFLAFSIFFIVFPDKFNALRELYMLLLMKGASFLLHIFRVKHIFDAPSLSFTFGPFTYSPDTMYAALKYTFLISATPLVLFGFSKKSGVLTILSFIVLIYTLNIIRIFFVLKYVNNYHLLPGYNHHYIFHLIIFTLPLCILVWETKGRLLPFFQNKDNKQITVVQKLTVRLLITGLVLILFSGKITWLFNLLTVVIFSISKFILSQFSIFVIFHDRKLVDANNYMINMGDPCVGLYIIIVFISVILISKGKVLQKLLYILNGVLIIIALNAIRVSLLFAYLHEPGSLHLAVHKWHAIYNNVIYVSVLLLWLVWFRIQQHMKNTRIQVMADILHPPQR
jgi:exosortase/archaeosortase family protein